MIFKNLAVLAMLGVAAADNLRSAEPEASELSEIGVTHHLDLEVVLENGERELFPLLPGTKCPTGHVCHSRSIVQNGVSPLASALKGKLKTPLTATMNWQEFNNDLTTAVKVRHKSIWKAKRRDVMAIRALSTSWFIAACCFASSQQLALGSFRFDPL